LDIVVHVPGAVLKKPLGEVTDADFDAVVAQNLRSAFLTLRAAGRHLAHNGRYIAISSTLAGAPPGPYSMYAAAKAGVEVMVRGAASEWAGRGITANAVAPGPIDNDFFRAPETPESIAGAAHLSPLGRLGSAGDVAPLVAFLASPAAGWVSGQTLQVNGAMY
jgi:3-oxoacyl-[acyl-carrier protein] reductase